MHLSQLAQVGSHLNSSAGSITFLLTHDAHSSLKIL